MPDTDPTFGYVYKWAAEQSPAVGMRVHAPVEGNGSKHAIIIAVDVPRPDGYTRAELSTIHKLA